MFRLAHNPRADSKSVTSILASAVSVSWGRRNCLLPVLKTIYKTLSGSDGKNRNEANNSKSTSGPSTSLGLNPEGINGSCNLQSVDLKALYARRIDHIGVPEHAAMLTCLSECNSEACIEQRKEWWTLAKPYNGSLLECNAPDCMRTTSIFRVDGNGNFMQREVISTFLTKTGPNDSLCYFQGIGTSTCPQPKSETYPRVINSAVGCFVVSRTNPRNVIAGPFKCPDDYKSPIKVTKEW